MKVRFKVVVFLGALAGLPGVASSQLSPATAPALGLPFAGVWCPANERGEDISEAPGEVITINRARIAAVKDTFEIETIERQVDDTYALDGVWSPDAVRGKVRIHMRGETFLAMSGMPQTLALFVRCDP